MDDFRCEVCGHGDAARVLLERREPLSPAARPGWWGHAAAWGDAGAESAVWPDWRWLCESHRP